MIDRASCCRAVLAVLLFCACAPAVAGYAGRDDAPGEPIDAFLFGRL